MMLRRRTRPGTTLVESALIYPVLFMIVAAIILLGTAVFRYQQVCHAAREAARYASVHGYKYATDPDVLRYNASAAAATEDSVYSNVVAPMVPWVQRSGVTVTWSSSATYPQNETQTRTVVVTDPATTLSQSIAVSNTVSVTVTYSWNTGWFGTIPVSSTSVAVMSF